MATDLVGNETLQKFIGILSDVNHLSAAALETGRIDGLKKLNQAVLQMYKIQHFGKEEAYTAIEDDAQVIYQNSDAIVKMLKSSEDPQKDGAAANAVRMFLRAIFDANVRILSAYGLV